MNLRISVYKAISGALLCSSAAIVSAGAADVIDASISALGEGRYRIEATLRHEDAGWDHYADRWDVVAIDGRILGSRELAHPHVDEQPFTRALTLRLPPGISVVRLQAHDSVHGLGGQIFELTVPSP